MSESRDSHIVFIAEGNNELDHYLPLISGFEKSVKVTIVCNPTINLVLTNEVHQYLCQKYNVQLENLTDFLKLSIYSKVLLLLHNLSAVFYKFFKFALLRKVFVYSLRLFKKSLQGNIKKDKIRRFFSRFTWSIIDVKVLNLDSPSENSLTPFLSFLKSEGIKNMMISHGLVIKYIELQSTTFDNFFKPAMMCCCNSDEIPGFQAQLPEVPIKPIGDLRYDRSYIKILEQAHEKLPKLAAKYRQTNSVLYLVGNLVGEINNRLHKEIIESCLQQFEQVTVKLHPRNPYYIPEYLDNPRVVQAGNDIDTSRLICTHQWVITPFSGVIMHAILANKNAVFYRPDYLGNERLVFEKSKIFEVQNIEELSRFKSSYLCSKSETEQFYIDFYCAGKEQSIIQRHIELLQL